MKICHGTGAARISTKQGELAGRGATHAEERGWETPQAVSALIGAHLRAETTSHLSGDPLLG
jgi:hypothetical protein